MSETVWKYSTKNFSVICTEYEPGFVDPLVHEQAVIDAIDAGQAILTHMKATVYFHEVEVGTARLGDCLYPLADSDNPYGHDRVFVPDHSYRRKVVRWAISDARRRLV